MVTASMNAESADDPTHRLMIRPTEITSVRPLLRIVSIVLPSRSLATSSLKTVFRKFVA